MQNEIEQMANIIALKAFEQAHLIDGDENLADIVATDLYEKGYRKIYDDHQRQCACYALGCQMAESLKREVATEFIEAVDSMMECVTAMTGVSLTYYGKYAELKKKYIKAE